MKLKRGFPFLSVYSYSEDGAAEAASSLVSKFVLWCKVEARPWCNQGYQLTNI